VISKSEVDGVFVLELFRQAVLACMKWRIWSIPAIFQPRS
jgi:hypothetical protein